MRISDWVQTCALPIAMAKAAEPSTDGLLVITSALLSVSRLGEMANRARRRPRDFCERDERQAERPAARTGTAGRCDGRQRKSGASGQRVSVREDHGGRRSINKKKSKTEQREAD